MTTAPVDKQPEPARVGPQSMPGLAPPSVDPAMYTDDAPELSASVREILAAPVDPELVETRATTKDGPEKLLFVPWVHYQAILLKAFGPGGYRLVPRGPVRTEGNVVTWSGALFVRDRGSSKFQFIKEAKGECAMQGGMTPGNAAEGAQSDCLVKCCKGLGIFMELFDPRWRRAWEAKYRPQHQQAVRAARWPAARGPSSGSSPPADSAAPSTPTADTTAPPPPADSAAGDTPASDPDPGEPATDEQKQAIKEQLKRLAWKAGYIKIWFASTFGIQLDDVRRAPEALSQRQADTCYYLMLAHGKPMYDALLADEKAKGNLP